MPHRVRDTGPHIGGVIPSRPTLTRLASSMPSSFLTAPKMMIFAPGFTSDLSPATEGAIGALDLRGHRGVGHGRARALIPGPEAFRRAALVLGENMDRDRLLDAVGL